jgi:hypothetical protein
MLPMVVTMREILSKMCGSRFADCGQLDPGDLRLPQEITSDNGSMSRSCQPSAVRAGEREMREPEFRGSVPVNGSYGWRV